jgi:hypothetical protein
MLTYGIPLSLLFTAALLAHVVLAQQQPPQGVVSQSPFACNLTALTPVQRRRHTDLTRQLRTTAREVRELPDGYALRLQTSEDAIRDTAEWIAFERLCCPFLGFNLEVAREGGPLWLHLTGRDGVKLFLKAELKLD